MAKQQKNKSWPINCEWQVAVSLGRCNHRMLGPRGGFKPDKKSPGGWLLGRAGTEDRDEEPGLLTRKCFHSYLQTGSVWRKQGKQQCSAPTARHFRAASQRRFEL